MAIKITLKNSVVQDSVPTTSHLAAVGELALNANINSLGIYMRASDNSIVKMAGPGSVTTPAASTTAAGIAELATSAETTTGTDTARVCTPAGVKAVTDAERTTSNNTYLALAGGTLSGVVAATAGSNSAPAIHFGDSDSGIYGGTNTVSLAAGGTQGLSVNGTDVRIPTKLGINGATPSTPLDVIANASGYAMAIRGRSADDLAQVRFASNDYGTIYAELESDATYLATRIGGSEALRVDSSKRLLVGHSSSRAISGSTARIVQVESTDAASGLSITRNSNNTNAAYISLGKTRGAAVGGTTTVQDNDALGLIQFAGADGTDVQSVGAEIKAIVDGTVAGNRMPGSLVFGTTADSAGSVSPTTRLTITSAGLVNVPDLGKFSVGSSNDALLWHDGTHTYFQNSTGNIVLQAKSGEDSIVATPDASVSLYYDTSKKFETTSAGCTLTGSLTGTGHVYLPDGGKFVSGASNDFQIYHDSTNTRNKIECHNGEELRIDKGAGTETLARFIPDGAVELYYHDSKKFETNSAGVQVTGQIEADEVYLRDSEKILLGTGSDLQIYHNGTSNILLANSGDLNIRTNNSENSIVARQNGSAELYYDNSKRIETTTDGIKLSGNGYVDLPDNGRLRLGNDYDFYLKAGTDDYNYIVSTNSQRLAIQAKDGENAIIVVPDAEVQLYYDGGKRVETLSNGVRILGAEGGNASLQFHADEGDDDGDKWQMYASDQGGFLAIKNYASGSWETSIECNNNGNVELYYDNSKKLHTHSGGITVSGSIHMDDSNKYYAGTSDDLSIYHDGSHSRIHDGGTGSLLISGSAVAMNNAAQSENMAKFLENGAVELYYDNSKKLETTSAGAKVLGDFLFRNSSDATQMFFDASDSKLQVYDSSKITFGNTDDLQIYHDGSNSYVSNETGDLIIQSASGHSGKVKLQPKSGENSLTCDPDSAVTLYYNNVKHVQTSSVGVKVYGAEGGDAWLELYADEGDDNADKWGIKSVASDNSLAIQNYASGSWEKNIECNGNGNVELYYDNLKRIETTSSGIQVTGPDNDYATIDLFSDLGTHDSDKFRLHVDDGGPFYIRNKTSGSWENNIMCAGNGAVELYYDNAKRFQTQSNGVGLFGLADSAGNSDLRYNSTNGTVSYDSSTRLVKKNIIDCFYGLDIVNQLKPRKYTRKDAANTEEIGFIADEVVSLIPEIVPIGPKSLVTKNAADTEEIPLNVDYRKICVVLTKAIQELSAKVAALEGA